MGHLEMALGFEDLRDKRVGIFGLGVEGQAAFRRISGVAAEIVLVDDRPSALRGALLTGEEGMSALATCDVVLKTPGIPRTRSEVLELERRGVTITSGLDLWLHEVDLRSVIAITGTKGKSTTTTVFGHLANGLGADTLVAGNIGVVPYDPETRSDQQLTVLELSSFQVSGLTISPPLVGVTSLGQDHLDWHGSVETYVADKLALTSRLGAELAIVASTPELRAAENLLGPHPRFIVPTDFDRELALALGLLGAHHAENVAVARALLHEVLGSQTEAELLAAARGYAPLESRFFQLPPLGEIAVIDDSLATNPLPTIAGLSALGEQRVALIAGGQDRGVDYVPLAQALTGRTTTTFVACLAEAGEVIASVTPSTDLLAVEKFATLDDAVTAAVAWLSGEGVLLLSPA
ncbi:MAG: UDP-N-acetylmuramoyl-L-alanine--D-glutamate ligase, partial [Actinomycetes bacterium]